MIIRRWRLAIILACALALGLAMYASARAPMTEPAAPANQGCIAQGADRRFAAAYICWAQRHASWKTEHEPQFLLLGNAQGASLGLAWPPYLVCNIPDGAHRWHMFRIGARYDRNWRGYIFPTIAWKHLTRPLRY